MSQGKDGGEREETRERREDCSTHLNLKKSRHIIIAGIERIRKECVAMVSF